MAASFSRDQRPYTQVESSYGIVPNSSGTATVTGSNCMRAIKAQIKPSVDLLVRQDKTGSRTITQGVAGRQNATWTIETSLAGNGAPGVVPDMNPLLVALFGQAATISAGVSVTYALADTIQSFSLFNYRTPSSVVQEIAAGCVVQDATFQLGQNIATVAFNGESKVDILSSNFSNYDTVGKSGLSAFPTEPGSPVTNGSQIAGFTGSFTLDGNVLANIRTASLKIAPGNQVIKDTFGSFFPTATMGDLRNVTLQTSLYDDDGSATTNLYNKAISKSPIIATIQIGTVAGNIWTFTVKGIQLEPAALDDSTLRWSANIAESRASGSSLTALDEVGLVIT